MRFFPEASLNMASKVACGPQEEWEWRLDCSRHGAFVIWSLMASAWSPAILVTGKRNYRRAMLFMDVSDQLFITDAAAVGRSVVSR